MSPPSLAVPNRIKPIIARLISQEAGFVDDPDDSGGATKYGITNLSLSLWRDQRVTTEDVKQLTIEEATQIYFQRYWLTPNLRELKDFWVKEFLFDWGVNSGPITVIKLFQDYIGTVPDGHIGPVTSKVLDEYIDTYRGLEQVAYGMLVDMRIIYYVRVVKRDLSQIKFLEGWIDRANSFRIYVT